MAFPTNILYIGEYVLRELGLGSYAPDDVSSGSTEMRLSDIGVFEIGGGQALRLDNDELVTYTGINGDQLTGIPASGSGALSTDFKGFTDTNRDFLYRAALINSYELERLLLRYRRWVDAMPLERDVDRKKHWADRGWFDTDVEVRDDKDDSYDTVTPNSESYENGTFEFTTARDESEQLYITGWGYNPFFSIADFIETFANDERWHTYAQIGQTARSGKDAIALANAWRRKGRWL